MFMQCAGEVAKAVGQPGRAEIVRLAAGRSVRPRSSRRREHDLPTAKKLFDRLRHAKMAIDPDLQRAIAVFLISCAIGIEIPEWVSLGV
jgi:hypothetical protein